MRRKRRLGARGLARLAGEEYYYTGKPCIRGHLEWRKSKDGACVKCQQERARIWYYVNRQRYIQHCMEAYWGQRDEILAKRREYRKRNLARLNARARERYAIWRKMNPRGSPQDIFRSVVRICERMERMNRLPHWLTAFDYWVFAEAVDIRIQREKATGIRWDIDHIIPLHGRLVSGLHVPSNIQVMPSILNERKNRHFNPEVGVRYWWECDG